MHASPVAADAVPPYPRRFSWKMRFFVTLMVFGMTYRCLSVLLPMHEWRAAFAVEALPRPMPSPAERKALRAQASEDNPNPVLAAYLLTADSLWEFGRPWPSAATRQRLRSPLDSLKCAACWLDARLQFLECLAGFREEWILYAPSLSTHITYVRARLFYDDDSEVVIRQCAEPADYTRFGHWFEERIGNYEYRLEDDDKQTWGYCHMLGHRYARNASGAQLVKIVLFQVVAVLAPPRADVRAHYQEQNRLTATPPRLPGAFRSDADQAADQVLPDYYEFDVEQCTGRSISNQAP